LEEQATRYQAHTNDILQAKDAKFKQYLDKVLVQRDEKLRQTAAVIESTLFPVEEAQKRLLQQLAELKVNFEASKAAKDGEVARMQHALQEHIRNEQRLREELHQERLKSQQSGQSKSEIITVCT
jgi:hypothetical protein